MGAVVKHKPTNYGVQYDLVSVADVRELHARRLRDARSRVAPVFTRTETKRAVRSFVRTCAVLVIAHVIAFLIFSYEITRNENAPRTGAVSNR